MEEWTFENADMSDAVMHRAKTYVDTGMAGRNGKYDKFQTGDEMKMNIHKNKMLWYNTRYCIRASYERS